MHPACQNRTVYVAALTGFSQSAVHTVLLLENGSHRGAGGRDPHSRDTESEEPLRVPASSRVVSQWSVTSSITAARRLDRGGQLEHKWKSGSPRGGEVGGTPAPSARHAGCRRHLHLRSASGSHFLLSCVLFAGC